MLDSLQIATKFRNMLGHNLANKIEFKCNVHLSDLQKVGMVGQLKRTNHFTQAELDNVSKVVQYMDFEGDELTLGINIDLNKNPVLNRERKVRVVSCHD